MAKAMVVVAIANQCAQGPLMDSQIDDEGAKQGLDVDTIVEALLYAANYEIAHACLVANTLL